MSYTVQYSMAGFPQIWYGPCYHLNFKLTSSKCDITYAYVLDNFNSDFNFQMFPYINFNIKVVSDHYADHHMGTAIKVLRSLMHSTVVYIYLHSYKINILICDTKICWISKETLMDNSDTLM